MDFVCQNDDVFDNIGQAVAVISMIILKHHPEGVRFTAFDAYKFEEDHVLNCYVDEETGTAILKVERRSDHANDNLSREARH